MRVLIASSATGGHIYPALAIADEIKRRDPDAEFLFVGAKWEISKGIVKSAGYEQVNIDLSGGFSRKNLLSNFKTLLDLLKSSAEIKKIIKTFKPDICIGTGGYIAGPVIRGARKAGIRTFIQEQNVIPGVANKLAERYADKVFVGFDESIKYFKDSRKIVVSGNPVRKIFSEVSSKRTEFREKYGVPEDAFCVLFLGGSQGAEAINSAAADVIEKLNGNYHFIMITGRDYYSEYEQKYKNQASARVCVMDYSDDIFEIYVAADLIVARAGALTVTEIAASGRASILIPSPNVTNNHQYYNAKTLTDAGAAILLTDDEIGHGKLASEISKLATDPEIIENMSEAASKISKRNALKVIVDEILGS